MPPMPEHSITARTHWRQKIRFIIPLWYWLRALYGFLRFVVRRMVDDRGVEIAASLTFTTLLSLVPLILLTLTIVAAFPVFADYGTMFRAFLFDNLMPDSASRIITVYLQEFTENAGKLTAAGLGMLAVTALSLMYTIERTFNSIWRVTQARPFARQMLLYWTVLTLGPLLTGVGLSLTASLSGQAAQTFPMLHWLGQVGSAVLGWVLLCVLYGMVPNRFVPPHHAMIGAAVAEILLIGARLAFAYYVNMARSYELIYGAFATFPILLLWLQLLWLIILFGAELTATLSYWQHQAWRRCFGSRRRLHDALQALMCLVEAQERGKSLALSDFRKVLRTGYDEIGKILDTLEHAEFIVRTADGGWALLKRANAISLNQLYHVFVLEGSIHSDTPVGAALQHLLKTRQNDLDIDLEAFRALTQKYSNTSKT